MDGSQERVDGRDAEGMKGYGRGRWEWKWEKEREEARKEDWKVGVKVGGKTGRKNAVRIVWGRRDGGTEGRGTELDEGMYG